MQDLKYKFLLIMAATALCAYIAWPSENKPGFKPGSALENVKLNLGLDLQGGAWFRVRLKSEGLSESELSKGTDEAMNILSRRINLRGLKEPRINRVGTHEIQIEVPGLKTKQQVDEFRKVILAAGHLEFKIEAPDDVEMKVRGGQVVPGYRQYAGGERGDVVVKEEPVLEGKAIADARPGMGEGFAPEVTFELTNEGARKFEKVTGENIGKRLAIILDDRLVSAPNIESKIGKSGRITGKFTQQEVTDMVTVLRTGSLVAPLEIVGSTFVGPGLGQDSIDRGMKASWASVFVVVAFMLFYYRHAGMVANIAMFMNIIFILALLALFGATLTLPGIGGLVLTMGMAVDANILVFERMREEKALGKTPMQCLDAGYSRAASAIIDGNLTTLLTGIVLYFFGTGPIQGFAITLCIGIMTTLFSALVCSKVMLQLMVSSGMIKEWNMMKLLATPNIPFMKQARPAFMASAVLCVAGVIIFFARGDEKYGIDFRGGVALNVRFKQAVGIEEVRKGVSDISGPEGKKYPLAEVQSVILGADAGSGTESREFRIRTMMSGDAQATNPEKMKEELEADIRKQFAGKIPEPSMQEGKSRIDAPHPYAGGGSILISIREEKPVQEAVEKIQKVLTGLSVMKPAEADKPVVRGLDAAGKETADKASTYEIYLLPENFVQWQPLAEKIADELKSSGYPLSEDPFPMVETVSSSIVTELKEKAIFSLILSWIGIILYLAVRFEFKWGVAAVVALVHNSILAVAITVLLHALVPKSWGIDLSLSLTTVAAVLTVIGYSVNDTVVIFDRLRENMREVKARGMEDVINGALNQTLSRTIITGMTVIFNLIVLAGVTATSGSGIVQLALPLLIGVVVGTYASLYIATPIVFWWRKGTAEAKA